MLGDWRSPPPPSLHSRSAHVWRVRLDADDDALATSLSDDERERASRFYRREDQRRFVVAHAMLRQILAGYLGANATSLELTTGEHGKPALAQSHRGPPLEFNLSHSGDFALVAVAMEKRVGVDIEQWRDTFDHSRLAEKVFSEHERRELEELLDGPHTMLDAFYSAWSRKEAYIKATGHGVSRGLQHFDVSLHPDQAARVLDDRMEPGAVTRWAMYALHAAEGYSAALVAEMPVDDILLFDAA